MDKWDKVYCLMRIMDIDVRRATKIANIATNECRDNPDEKVMVAKVKAHIATLTQDDSIMSFLNLNADKPKLAKAPNLEPPPEARN